jgi:alpha-galactosidase
MYKILFVLALLSGSIVGKADGSRAGDFGADGFGAGDSIQIQYGRHGELSYNVKKGTFNVYNDHRLVFSDIAAVVRANGGLLSSVDYATRSYRTAAVEDRFGKGVKHIFILQGKGRPAMTQVFYTYPGREYFLTAVSVSGGRLESNYMSPFDGAFSSLTGDVHTLFIPFDNDTFISYDAKPLKDGVTNVSAEAGVVYDNETRKGWVVGSVEHTVWKTGVRTSAGISASRSRDSSSGSDAANKVTAWGGYTDEAVNRDKIPHGSIRGRKLRSPLIFVGCFDDWRAGLESYGQANRLQETPYVFNWTKPTPVGWNSWGVLQDHITFDKVTKVTDFFADSLPGFRVGGTAFIDLDAFWDFMPGCDIKGDHSKLKAFVDHCLARGLQPGVYWAPFADFGYKGGGNNKAEGSDFTFKEMWTKVGGGYHDNDGGRSLDPTHPGTRRRIAYFCEKLKACGFKMIKIDFLGHGAAESTGFYDGSVRTGMEAYRIGMEYLVDQLGGQMLVYAAISPSLATGRYAHSRRIACDAFKAISDTRYTLNAVTYGWWLTYVYNFVDADHVVLATQSEGENRARMLSSVITGTFFTGDDFSAQGPWLQHAIEWYKNPELLRIVGNGKAFEPVEGNTGNGPASLFVRKIDGALYLAVFNYGQVPASFIIDAARIGLSPGRSYTGVELLQGGRLELESSASITLTDRASVTLPPADAALYKIIL